MARQIPEPGSDGSAFNLSDLTNGSGTLSDLNDSLTDAFLISPTNTLVVAKANGQNDGVGARVILPSWVNTARGIELELDFLIKSASSGDVVFQVEYGRARIGDTFPGTAIETLTNTISVTSDQDEELQRTTFNLDIASFIPGDKLWFALTRNATSGTSPTGDDYNGNVHIEDLNGYAYSYLLD